MERPFPAWIEEEFALLRAQEQLILDDDLDVIHEHVVRLRMLAAALTTHMVRKYPSEPSH